MVSANTDALTTALSTVMTVFNSRIEVQYGANFQKFNEKWELFLGKLIFTNLSDMTGYLNDRWFTGTHCASVVNLVRVRRRRKVFMMSKYVF